MGDEVVHPSSFSHDWWRVTLSSIGDAVIATDLSGRVAFLNPVAEALTGWTQSDAFGLPLDQVFVIVNEITRTRMQDPVGKVLQSGHLVGLANHTLLINRIGRDIPIDDSAAPIRNEQGSLAGVVLIFRDITERRRTELSQSYLAAIVESSFDAIIGKNLDGIITSWNQAAERIFGYSTQEAIGQTITLIIPPERHDEEVEILARLRRGERTEHFETVRVRKDGTPINISLTVSPIKHSTGTIIGASKIARDITESKNSERERERLLKGEQIARSKAEEANRLKDEFLATVSHELRTPLTSILGWASLLRTARVSEQQTTLALETIHRNAKTQAQVIEDLLDVSRIITGKLHLEMRPTMASQLVESAIASVQPMAKAKGVGLHVQIGENAGSLAADSGRLQQVIWNLLNNAIKFTPGGGHVRVMVRRADSEIEIVVSDTGQGIRPEFLPHVFDRFRQAESSTTRKHGGLGLGLAIVRQLVELHGGTVTASSKGQGQGATFAVRLPAMRVPQEGTGRSAAPEEHGISIRTPDASGALKGVKALIVDDDEDTRQLLRATIEQAGAKVRDAASAEEGLRKAKLWKPSIILADIGMPGKDGYEFIKELREWERHYGGRTPAVALTAYARPEDEVHALNAGYQAHIAKPIEPARLVVVIANQLGRSGPDGGFSE
jgi:PAS domain S-box-containing protein